MDYLELVMYGVETQNIKKILKNINVLDQGNIKNSHFYVNSQDITYSNSIDFKKYYSVPSTGLIVTHYADIGVRVSEVVTVISGCYPSVEITINFKGIVETDFIKINQWMKKNANLATSMVFGYEPLELSDEIIYSIFR